MYTSFIRPQLEYASVVRDGCLAAVFGEKNRKNYNYMQSRL